MWTNQMQETLNSKKKGDVAFRHKDFRAAIECYTQVKMVNHPFYEFYYYYYYYYYYYFIMSIWK